AFHTELNDRITLSIAAQIDTLLEIFHGVDMIHPLGVYILEQDHTLQFPHELRTKHRFALGLEHVRTLPEEVLALFRLYLSLLLIGRIDHLILGDGPAQEEVPQTMEIPVMIIVRSTNEPIHCFTHSIVHHLADDSRNIYAVQHLLTLLVDDFTLTVGN